ncbi:MAG: S41 family peptidase [Planctomycetota bacterium]
MGNLKGKRGLCVVITLGIMAGLAFGRPPQVIKTIPENGNQNVDPGLRRIQIVFDQDMNIRYGYSICGGGEKYPESIGRPKWINNRTLVLRVRLKPNHKYQMSVNCPSAKNCVGANGEPAEIYPIRFRTGLSERKDSSYRSGAYDNKQAVEELREAIDKHYSYRDIRRVDWDKVFDEKKDELISAKGSEEFAKAAGQLLANAKDKHIWLVADGKRIASYMNPVRPNANFEKLNEFVPNFQKRSAVVYTGRFDDGIGYIFIDSWGDNHSEALEQTYVALWEFSDEPGLIIDVRGNGGGAEPLAQDFAGCFIDEPKVYAQHVYRAAEEPTGFSQVHSRVLQPNKQRPKYRGKVAVLMGPVNMSSCEAFLLMMKQVPNCKLTGQTSQGSSGNPKPYDIGNGVTVYLPCWKAMRPDGSCFEGEGIKPDIHIQTTSSDFAINDPVLEAALEWLRSS